MFQIIFISIMVVMAALAAIGAAIFAVGGLQLSRKTSVGILQYFYYPMLLGNAIGVAYSGRDFTGGAFDPETAGSPIAVWAIRFTSLFTMMACADQVVRYLGSRPKVEPSRAILALAFIVFWLTNSIVPAYFSSHTAGFSLSWLYVLVLGFSLLCMTEASASGGIKACRNALILFCLLSILLVPVLPGVALDSNYTTGLISSRLPRLAGLAPHAIILATNAAIAIWCLMVMPMEKRWVNRAAWIICLFTLFMGQSKSVWITFALGTPVIWMYQRKNEPLIGSRNIGQMNVIYAFGIAAALTGMLGLAIYFLAGNGADRLTDFSYTKEGVAITSFTGRDRIWDVALREWRTSPVFGYGLSLFDADFRKQIAMSNATHGHNEIFDTLGRTGTVGTIGVSFYLLMLVWAGFRYARTTGGLTLVLAMSMILRSISEPSLTVNSIGISEINHYLLLTVIALGIARTRLAKSVKSSIPRSIEAPGGNFGVMAGIR